MVQCRRWSGSWRSTRGSGRRPWALWSVTRPPWVTSASNRRGSRWVESCCKWVEIYHGWVELCHSCILVLDTLVFTCSGKVVLEQEQMRYVLLLLSYRQPFSSDRSVSQSWRLCWRRSPLPVMPSGVPWGNMRKPSGGWRRSSGRHRSSASWRAVR